MTRHRQMLRTSYFLHGLAMQHFPHGSGTLHADLRNPVQASSLSARCVTNLENPEPPRQLHANSTTCRKLQVRCECTGNLASSESKIIQGVAVPALMAPPFFLLLQPRVHVIGN